MPSSDSQQDPTLNDAPPAHDAAPAVDPSAQRATTPESEIVETSVDELLDDLQDAADSLDALAQDAPHNEAEPALDDLLDAAAANEPQPLDMDLDAALAAAESDSPIDDAFDLANIETEAVPAAELSPADAASSEAEPEPALDDALDAAFSDAESALEEPQSTASEEPIDAVTPSALEDDAEDPNEATAITPTPPPPPDVSPEPAAANIQELDEQLATSLDEIDIEADFEQTPAPAAAAPPTTPKPEPPQENQPPITTEPQSAPTKAATPTPDAGFETAEQLAEQAVGAMGVPVETPDPEQAQPARPQCFESPVPAADIEVPAPPAVAEAPAPPASTPPPATTPPTQKKQLVANIAAQAKPASLHALNALAQPLRLLPPAHRQLVGWLAVMTVFNAVFMWLALLLKG